MCIIFAILLCLTSAPNTLPVKRMLHLSCIMLKNPKTLTVVSAEKYPDCASLFIVNDPMDFASFSTCKKNPCGYLPPGLEQPWAEEYLRLILLCFKGCSYPG